MSELFFFRLTVDVDAEAGPELVLGQFGVRVEVAVVPEVPRARPVPRRPAGVAHRHPEVAELALAEHAVPVISRKLRILRGRWVRDSRNLSLGIFLLAV